ncbi:hypothetical protein [Bacillus halotolerans]|uniref:hypothetical protein n=1 Tax=Bacillus halotolerans TaxID=260554 RepID=UPI000D041F9F|nr:hypothetical protein [Bacillus halotolerans]PRS19857.1 hypothetical protein C6W25_13935 [Bacillus halotolerans]
MIYINIDITNLFMKEAVPLARQMEGDWAARMKIALNLVIIDYYLNRPLTNENVNELLRRGVSYRRICKHYGIGRKDIAKLRQSSIV